METYAVRRVVIPVGRDGTTAPTGTSATHAGRPRILLVTPDADLRAAATRALESNGYEVVPVAHAGHAILACMTAPRIDAMATELWMEDTSGPALAERLRRHHPDLQVLYFAETGTPECDEILVRPFTRDDLLARLESRVAARA